MLNTPGPGLQPEGAELRKSPADQRMKFKRQWILVKTISHDET